MALSSADLGSRVTWPINLVPAGQPSIPTTNKSRALTQPTQIVRDTFTDVSTIDDDGFVTAVAGANATTSSLTLGGALCSGGVGTNTVPRAITATVTHGSSVVAETIALTGTDAFGKTITETLTIPATGTSQVVTSNQAFKTLTAASQTAAGDASANTIKLGDSKKLGFSRKCSSVVSVAEELNGAAATAGTMVKASTTADNDARGTYTPNGTPNGTNDWDVWYLSDDPVSV